MTTLIHHYQAAKNLLFPIQCAGCGKWDQELCDACGALCHSEVASTVIEDATGIPEVELLSLGSYEGPLRSVILTAKHDPHRDLSDFLFQAGITLGAAAARRIRAVGRWPETILVAPAPSSHARRRKRAEIVPIIGLGMVDGLGEGGLRTSLAESTVRLKRRARGQSGLSASERSRGRLGALELGRVVPRNALVVIVDDVVTTGATMRAMVDLLPGQVVIAAALASA